MSVLNDLQHWYAAQVDGDWEHSYGISIETLDNPGWSVGVDLTGTLLEQKSFVAVHLEESDNSWVRCQVVDKKFSGFGDASRLEEILTRFLDWAKSEPEWLAVPELSEEEGKYRSDLSFWQFLGEEVGPELCQQTDCQRLRVLHSVLCRQHHFEAIRHKACPFSSDPLDANYVQVANSSVREKVRDPSDPVNDARLIWSDNVAESIVYELTTAGIVQAAFEERAVLIMAQEIHLNLLAGKTP